MGFHLSPMKSHYIVNIEHFSVRITAWVIDQKKESISITLVSNEVHSLINPLFLFVFWYINHFFHQADVGRHHHSHWPPWGTSCSVWFTPMFQVAPWVLWVSQNVFQNLQKQKQTFYVHTHSVNRCFHLLLPVISMDQRVTDKGLLLLFGLSVQFTFISTVQLTAFFWSLKSKPEAKEETSPGQNRRIINHYSSMSPRIKSTVSWWIMWGVHIEPSTEVCF